MNQSPLRATTCPMWRPAGRECSSPTGRVARARLSSEQNRLAATDTEYSSGNRQSAKHMTLAAMLMTLVATAGINALAQTAAPSSASPPTSSFVATASSDSPIPLRSRNPRYRLRKGDTFDVDFAFSPEFNQTVAVQPDGYVSLRGAGAFFVEGQTIPELTETIKGAYAKILHDPAIEIAPKDFEKPYFIVGGQVQKPGKYDLRSDLTVTEAVAIAGGFNDRSKNSQVVLYHPKPTGGYDSRVLNVKQLLAKRDLSEDIQVQPGDLLYIPQNKFSKIRPFIPTPNAGMGAFYDPAIN